MTKGFLHAERLSLKLVSLAILAVLGLCIGGGISYIIFGKDAESINAIRWGQFVMSIFAFVLPAVGCAFLFGKRNSSFFNLNKYPSSKFLLIGCLCFLMILPFINLLAWLNMSVEFPSFLAGLETELHKLEDLAEKTVTQILSLTSPTDLLLNVIFIALVPAVTEELFFRGTLQKLLGEKFSSHGAVWITAFVFSAFHFQFFGFVPRLMLGVLLGYFYVWSGSLYLSMTAHFLNNAIAVFAGYLAAINHIKMEDIDNIGAQSQWIVGLFSLLLVLPLLMYMAKNAVKEPSTVSEDTFQIP